MEFSNWYQSYSAWYSIQYTAAVTRPLFFEFQKDVNTYSIDRQFMIGSAIMISPVLTQGEGREGERGRDLRYSTNFHRSYQC